MPPERFRSALAGLEPARSPPPPTSPLQGGELLAAEGGVAFEQSELGAVGDAELFVDAVEADLDRALGQAELVADLAVAQALADQPGDPPLARGEAGERAARRRAGGGEVERA